MSPRQKKSVVAARSMKKTAKRTAKKTEAARASHTDRRHAGARVKHARAAVKQSGGRAKRILNSTPVRVLLGASAVALVLAKLKHLV
jgi:hypothetical protein